MAGIERRLAEANRLGFSRVIASARTSGRTAGLEHQGLAGIDELVGTLGGA